MDHNEFPAVPADLLQSLERRFPDRAPNETDSIDTIRLKTGQVSVVRFLRAVFEKQNETILKPEGTTDVQT